MKGTICTLIRTLGVAALLAAAAISVPAGNAHAEAKFPSDYGLKSCTLNGKTYPADTTFTTNGKEYHCDGYEGKWIIIIDEDRGPAQPPHSLLHQIPVAPRSGGVLAQP